MCQWCSGVHSPRCTCEGLKIPIFLWVPWMELGSHLQSLDTVLRLHLSDGTMTTLLKSVCTYFVVWFGSVWFGFWHRLSPCFRFAGPPTTSGNLYQHNILAVSFWPPKDPSTNGFPLPNSSSDSGFMRIKMHDTVNRDKLSVKSFPNSKIKGSAEFCACEWHRFDSKTHHIKTLAMGPAVFYSQGNTASYEEAISSVNPTLQRFCWVFMSCGCL